MDDRLTLRIGTVHTEITPDSPIRLLLENVSADNLDFACLPHLEITGSFTGWAPVDIRCPQARPWDMQCFPLLLAPSQSVYAEIRLRDMTYAEGTGSNAPSLSWEQLVKNRSLIDNSMTIQLLFDMQDTTGNQEQIVSNRLTLRLLLEEQPSTLALHNNIDNIGFLIDNLGIRLEALEDAVNRLNSMQLRNQRNIADMAGKFVIQKSSDERR